MKQTTLKLGKEVTPAMEAARAKKAANKLLQEQHKAKLAAQTGKLARMVAVSQGLETFSQDLLTKVISSL